VPRCLLKKQYGCKLFLGNRTVRYAGPETNDPLAYRYYDPKRVVLGKTMEEHLRISVAYWHTFCSNGADIFGGGTFDRPWHKGSDPVAMAEHKLEEAMSFVRSSAFRSTPSTTATSPDLGNMRDSQKPSRTWSTKPPLAQEQSGIKLLWGTANLFSHPRYMAGAATNPDPEVFACAALQVRDALEATKKLGGRPTCCGAAVKATTPCSTPTSSAKWRSSAASSRWLSSTSTRSASTA
jgi:xylose isomerase